MSRMSNMDIRQYFSNNKEWLDEFINWRISYIRTNGLNASNEGLLELHDAANQSTLSNKLESICAWARSSERRNHVVSEFLKNKLISGESKTTQAPSESSVSITNLRDLLAKTEKACDEYSKLYKSTKNEYAELQNRFSTQEFALRNQIERAEAAEKRVKELEEIIARQSAPTETSPSLQLPILINWQAIRHYFAVNPAHVMECYYGIADAADANTHGLTVEDRPQSMYKNDHEEKIDYLHHWGTQSPIRGQFIKKWVEKRSGKVLV